MPNTYFQRQPLDEAIKTLASGCLRCEICCTTCKPDYIDTVPQYDKWDVLFISDNKAEVTRQLKMAFAYAKRYAGENCKNKDIPKFEDLKETKSDSYTIFIRYK